MRPLLTALIDTYNHEHFIEEAIVSVLEQGISSAEMEVIVVDDGSVDNTATVVRKFAPRVRYLRKVNGGQASAFNAGIPEARGEFVAFLDGDDWWAKDKLVRVLDAFTKNPDVGAVGHGLCQVHSDSGRHRLVVPDQVYRLHLQDVAAARLFSLLRGFLGTSRLTIRRAVLDRIMPIPEELEVEADEYIFTLAPAVAPAFLLNEPLLYYRFHSNNLFMIQRDGDAIRLTRKHRVLAALLRTLPRPLAQLGVSQAVIETVLQPLRVDAERMALAMHGGKPWRTFAVERTSFSLDYSNASLGYRLFKSFVLGLTLVTPPRQFYKLRTWYSARGFRRMRRILGEPTPAAPVLEIESLT